MAIKSLAVKYRPTTFDDVTEQGSVKIILQEQIDTGTIKNGYLFCGSAGTGKTTCARIFANEINNGQGNPIEMDAASNNSVEDIRNVIAQAQTKSLDSEYKIFIIDEAHALSNSAWQAMLKTLEEPPLKSIFIFCTTDPQKIPKTILSRVQRYDFQRISQKGIVQRLDWILAQEVKEGNLPEGDHQDLDAVEYIAKLAEGGMRDAITLMDKCLSYSTELTVDNVVKALGVADYDIMFSILDDTIEHRSDKMLAQIDSVYRSGIDMKQFIKTFTEFTLDVCKYCLIQNFDTIKIPNTYEGILKQYGDYESLVCREFLKVLIKLNADIKWETNPKSIIEATFYIFSSDEVTDDYTV